MKFFRGYFRPHVVKPNQSNRDRVTTLPGRLDQPLRILVAAIALGMGFSAYREKTEMREHLVRDLDAHKHLLTTFELISRFKDAETSQRGYLLTGSDNYLAPYAAATAAIPGLLDQVTEAAGADPAMMLDVRLLRNNSQEKLAELAETIKVRREHGHAAAVALVRAGTGKIAMDAILAACGYLTDRELEIVDERRSGAMKFANQAFWLTVAGIVCLLAAIAFLQWAIGREIQARRQVSETLDKAHIIMCRLDGTIFYWNSAAQWIYGWTEEEAIGHKIFELLGAELPKPYEEIYADLVKAGSWTGEIRQHSRDGAILWASSHWSLQHDAKGVPFSLIKMNNDITEWKRNSEALRISERTIRSLFDNAGQGILVADRKGRVTECNASLAALFGRSRAQLLGAPVETLFSESDRVRYLRYRAAHVAHSGVCPMAPAMDMVALHEDGSEFPVEVSLGFVEESQGADAELAVAFISDISVRKEAAHLREDLIARLEAGMAERDVLLQEVHHRVKNNMAVIVGLLGMQSRAVGDERLTLALEQSQQRVSSMALIHEFLYAGEDMNSVDFGAYFKQLVSGACAAYALDLAPGAVTVETDEIQLPVYRAIPCGLIANELLSNAMKYAFADGRKGRIKLAFVRLESGALSLTCMDDGVGIAESFNWRNAPSTGLKIVQILAKQLHGELTLDRSGGKTRFELTFPDRDAEPAGTYTVDKTAAQPTAGLLVH
jgi:PAS domain S-box-containing protein